MVSSLLGAWDLQFVTNSIIIGSGENLRHPSLDEPERLQFLNFWHHLFMSGYKCLTAPGRLHGCGSRVQTCH
jgi:hypothetical protein